MERPSTSPQICRFGPFELSRDVAELRKNGIHLKLQDQPFQVLCTLLDHPGELVTRDQLQQQLWPHGTFVDFEHGLNTAIKKLRDVLSDDADSPRYIETVPRKGYRFIAQVNGETELTLPVSSPAHQKRLRNLIVLSGLAVVTVIGFAVYSAIRSSPLRVVSTTKQLTFTGDVMNVPQTDGRRVFYTRLNQSRIYSVSVSGGEANSFVVNVRDPILLHISPNGSTLLMRERFGRAGSNEDRIWLVPTNGSPLRPLGDFEARWAAWSPDGKRIAFSKDRSIYVTDDDGSTFRKLYDLPGLVTFVRWSPDGRHLRFDVMDSNTFVPSIWEAQLGGEPRSLSLAANPGTAVMNGDWTRDGGQYLFTCDHDGRWECCYLDERRFRDRRQIPTTLTTLGFDVISTTPSLLENRLFILGQQRSSTLFKFDLNTRKALPFLTEVNAQLPTFSTDGKWMVFSQLRNRRSTLWRVNNDGTQWLQLTDSKLEAWQGTYSPDGQRIALYAKGTDGLWKIYVVPHEGGAIQKMDAPVESQVDPNWLDNNSILFGSPPKFWYDPEAPRAIYSYNLRTKSLMKFPGTDQWFSPRISPDRRSFVALTIDEHKLGLYDLASRQWRILIDEPKRRVGGPFWSRDGNSVYATIYDNMIVIVRVRLRDGFREDVLRCQEVTGTADCDGAIIAPDGSMLLDSFRYEANLFSLEYK